MTIEHKTKALALASIHRPVRYDQEGQRIRDVNGETVSEIRGWGRLQYLDRPEERQDAIGALLVHLINEADALEPMSALIEAEQHITQLTDELRAYDDDPGTVVSLREQLGRAQARNRRLAEHHDAMAKRVEGLERQVADMTQVITNLRRELDQRSKS